MKRVLLIGAAVVGGYLLFGRGPAHSGLVCVESWRVSTPMESLRYGAGRLEQRWVSPDELPQWSRTVVGGGRLGWPCGRPNDPF
jgi:hypothetical protein